MKKTIFLLFCSFFVISDGRLMAQLRYALVIGNGDYKVGTSLRNPTHDAKLLSAKLQQCKFRVFEYENLSDQDFRKAIEDFYKIIKSAPCETLFFYSGHGIQHKGENYLIPVDANLTSEADIEDQCIRLQLIYNKLQNANTKANIIILDACRNDPFSKGWSRGEDEKGLAVMSQTPGESFIAFATAPDQVAADGKGTNSPFSTAIAKFMGEPGSNIFHVFQNVSIEVKKTNPNQSPWNNYSMDRDFYFIPPGGFPPSKGQMEILVTEDCNLFIEGKNKGSYPGGEYIYLDYPAGNYKVRAVSQHDPSVYYDTMYSYNPKKDTITNQMVIPLNNRVVDISKKLKPLLDSIKFNMVGIEGGSFMMGSNGGNNEEKPEHKVELLSYSISKYEVTQQQYDAIMRNNPSVNNGCADCPVENISWTEANEFIRALNNLTQDHYRLPTEAEWEFAATGGSLSNKFMFSGGKKLDKQGWYYDNSGRKSHPVGRKAGNELGIVDMSGNIAEWCSDWYDGSFYSSRISENPKGPESGKEKVIRGGSWDDYDQPCRVFSRNKKEPGAKDKRIGFRLAK